MDRRTFLASAAAGAVIPTAVGTAGASDGTERITISEPDRIDDPTTTVYVDGPMDDVIGDVLDIFDREYDHYEPALSRSEVRRISIAVDDPITVQHRFGGTQPSYPIRKSGRIGASYDNAAGDVCDYLADRYDPVPTKLVQSVHISRDRLEVTYLDTRVPGVGFDDDTDYDWWHEDAESDE